MGTEQALAKGTRVEIIDVMHRFYGLQAEIIDNDRGEHMPRTVRVATTHEGFAFPQQYKVLSEPEPTIGQLVDAMHQEIERACERMDLLEPEIRIDIFPGKKSFVAVRFYEGEELLDNPGCTLEPEPEAALKAMIKRLEQMRKAEK